MIDQPGLFDDHTGSNLNTDFDRFMRQQQYAREVTSYSREVAAVAQRLDSFLADPRLLHPDMAAVRDLFAKQLGVLAEVTRAGLATLADVDQHTGAR